VKEGFKEKEIISASAAQHVHHALYYVASPLAYSEYALSILKDEQAKKNSSKGQVVYNDLGIGLLF
jgi:hypothetical protein